MPTEEEVKAMLERFVDALDDDLRAGLLARRLRSARRHVPDVCGVVAQRKGRSFTDEELNRLGQLATRLIDHALRSHFACSAFWRLNWLPVL
jgi:hypothetical protein